MNGFNIIRLFWTKVSKKFSNFFLATLSFKPLCLTAMIRGLPTWGLLVLIASISSFFHLKYHFSECIHLMFNLTKMMNNFTCKDQSTMKLLLREKIFYFSDPCWQTFICQLVFIQNHFLQSFSTLIDNIVFADLSPDICILLLT